MVTLSYVAQESLSSASTSAAARYIKTNDAWDVDPAFLSTSTIGFTEYSAFYNYYRVIGYTYTLEVINTNTFPVIFTVGNCNTNLGLSSGNNTTIDLFPSSGNQLFTQRVLAQSAAGGCKSNFSGSHTICQVVGSSAPETEDNFRALTNASPLDLTYLVYGATGFASTNLAAFIDVVIRFHLKIRFYDRKVLAS